MKMRNIIMYILLGTTLLGSCTRNDRMQEEVEELHEKSISFPTGYVSTNPSLTDRTLNSKAKVITFIENPPCTQCIIKTIHIYQREIAKISKNISYVIVISTKEKKKFIEILDSIPLRYPVLLYDSNSFCVENHLEDISAFNRTFLLDTENKIILTGEPFNKEKLADLYRRTTYSMCSK